MLIRVNKVRKYDVTYEWRSRRETSNKFWRGSTVLVRRKPHRRHLSGSRKSGRISCSGGRRFSISVGLSVRSCRFASGSSRFISGESVFVFERRSRSGRGRHVGRGSVRSPIRSRSGAVSVFAVAAHRRSRRIVLVADVNDQVTVALVSGILILKQTK